MNTNFYAVFLSIFTLFPHGVIYALKRAGRDASHDYDALTVERVVKDFYMDDLLISVSTEEPALKLALETISLLKNSGFRLCKFVSNSRRQ